MSGFFPRTSKAAASANALSFLRNSRSSSLMRFLSVFCSGLILAFLVSVVLGLPAIQACFHALTCSGYNPPLARQYSLNSTTDREAFSNTTENFSSLDHLSDELTFDTFNPEVLNCFCQLYRVESLMPSCSAN